MIYGEFNCKVEDVTHSFFVKSGTGCAVFGFASVVDNFTQVFEDAVFDGIQCRLVQDFSITPSNNAGSGGVLVVDLIEVGVYGGAPCCCPNC